MHFSREDVQKLADLSRIAVSEDELERMRETLAGVIEYVEQIGKVDTSAISDTACPPSPSSGCGRRESGLEARVREDVERGCDARIVSRIISQFPDRENDSLVVPGVFHQEPESGAVTPEREEK